MKKLWILAALAVAATIFTGCNKDKTSTDYAPDAVGSYEGTITVPETTVMSMTIPAQTIPDVTITVEKSGENKVTLKMNETIDAAAIGALALNVSCPATTSDGGDGKIKIGGNTMVTLEQPLPGIGLSELPVSINGTIDASGNANFTITVMSLINVAFAGTK